MELFQLWKINIDECVGLKPSLQSSSRFHFISVTLIADRSLNSNEQKKKKKKLWIDQNENVILNVWETRDERTSTT